MVVMIPVHPLPEAEWEGGRGVLIAHSLMTSSHAADKTQHNLQTGRSIKMIHTDSICYMVSCKSEIYRTENLVIWYSQRRGSFQRTEHLSQHPEASFVKNNASSCRMHFNHQSVPFVTVLAHPLPCFEFSWPLFSFWLFENFAYSETSFFWPLLIIIGVIVIIS